MENGIIYQLWCATRHAASMVFHLFSRTGSKKASKECEHTHTASRARAPAEPDNSQPERTEYPFAHFNKWEVSPATTEVGWANCNRGLSMGMPPRVLNTPSGNRVGLSSYQNNREKSSQHVHGEWANPNQEGMNVARKPGVSAQPTQRGYGSVGHHISL